MKIVINGFKFLCLAFLVGMSCNYQSKETEKAEITTVDTVTVGSKRSDTLVLSQELKFKKWVKDTIPFIKTVGQFKERRIILREDSLLIQIMDKYELKVDGQFKSKVNDINAALDLLNIYNEKPRGDFHLEYWINNYYLPSMPPEFIREHDYDIEKFVVFTKDSLIDYTFIKGNMTNREAVARKAENQKIK